VERVVLAQKMQMPGFVKLPIILVAQMAQFFIVIAPSAIHIIAISVLEPLAP
jgi:hypothetical protein